MNKLGEIYRNFEWNFIAFGVIIAFTGCQSTSSSSTDSDDETSEVIEISSTQFNGAKMELGTLSTLHFQDVIHANGKFDVPPENRADVSAYFGGYVKDISLLPGQEVKKGEVLFTMENPQYLEVQRDFLQAKGRLKFLKNDFDRQKSLYENNATSEKVYLQSESDYTLAVVEYETLKKTLGLMNIDWKSLTENSIQSTISVLAPIGGYVTFVHANKGVCLNPSDVATSIVDPDHMHVELVIFEKDLSKVKEDQTIVFNTLDNPRQKELASIYLINKVIDEESRSISIHGHLNDEERANHFSPGMYIEAEIVVETDTLTVLPASAVVELDNKFFVLELMREVNGNYTFQRKEVKIGRFTENEWEIVNTNDFSENTTFLTKGAYVLIKELGSGGNSHSH
jgi:cobalt-zinc-cadmium efflux system membrane fusion protein